MEYVSKIDECLVNCAEQIRALWQEARQYGLFSADEEAERLQSMKAAFAELLEE